MSSEEKAQDPRPKNRATGEPMSGVDVAAKAHHEKWMEEQKKLGVEHSYHARNGEDLMQEYEYLSDMAQADVRARAAQPQPAAKEETKSKLPEQQ